MKPFEPTQNTQRSQEKSQLSRRDGTAQNCRYPRGKIVWLRRKPLSSRPWKKQRCNCSSFWIIFVYTDLCVQIDEKNKETEYKYESILIIITHII